MDHLVAALQDTLDGSDRVMFWRSVCQSVQEAVMSFIEKLGDDTASKITIRMFPNQKLWVDKIIHNPVRAHSAAYNTTPMFTEL